MTTLTPGVADATPLDDARAQLREAVTLLGEISPLIGPDRDIPAPDVGTDEPTMAWLMDTYFAQHGHTVLGVATGKPLSLGGSRGRATATSRGVVHIALAALRHCGIEPAGATAAVQGFRKVGRGGARFLQEADWRVVAVSDQYGAEQHPGGIDVPALEAHVNQHGTVVGYPRAAQMAGPDLLELDVDLLVPAAVEGVINSENAAGVQARGRRDGPTTPDVDNVLQASGALVVPDILANAGGVIVSYFEWVQGNQAYWWSADEVEARLAERMIEAWRRVVDHADQIGQALRTAATALAVKRVAQAHLLRGLYP